MVLVLTEHDGLIKSCLYRLHLTFVQKHKMTVAARDEADLNLYCCVQGTHKCQLACFGSNIIIIKYSLKTFFIFFQKIENM